MRLFLALDVPAGVRADLDRALEPARKASPDALRWARPDGWHVTLAFFGEVPDDLVGPLEQRLHRAVDRHAAPSVALGRLGTFGSARAARVLWVAVEGDVPTLRAVAASARAVRRRLTRGRRSDTRRPDADASRPLRPHLTLARARPSADVQQVLAAGPTEPRDRGWHWRADEALLVRSDLGAGPGGTARHTVLARLPFSLPGER